MNTDSIRILKTGTCLSLSGRTKLTYEVGGGPDSQISLRITKTAGTGSFSKDWVALERIHALLERNAGKPITSHTLAPLFTSANNPGFTLAVMKHERLVRPIADNPRCYERLDGKAFFGEIQALMGSKPASAKTKTKTAPATESKAASPKPDATPATEAPKTRPAVTSRKSTGRWFRNLGSPRRQRRPSDDLRGLARLIPVKAVKPVFLEAVQRRPPDL